MGRWQVEPERGLGNEPVTRDDIAPALRSIFSGRDWTARSSTVREASAGWRAHEGDILDAPQGRAEAADPLPQEAADYPLGIARGQIADTYIVASVSADQSEVTLISVPRDTTNIGHDRAIPIDTKDPKVRLPTVDTTKRPQG